MNGLWRSATAVSALFAMAAIAAAASASPREVPSSEGLASTLLDASQCPEFGAVVDVDDLASSVSLGCDHSGSSVIFPDGRSMLIPDEGVQVIASAATVEGEGTVPDIVVENLGTSGVVAAKIESRGADGETVEAWGPDAAQEDVLQDLTTTTGNAGGPYTNCNDGLWSQSGAQRGRTYSWRYNEAVSYDGLFPGVRRGGDVLTNVVNDCGFNAARVDLTSSYLGTTAAGANIYGNATCAPRDGQNTQNFGVLPSNILGVACRWTSSTGTPLEADVAYNSTKMWHAGQGACPAQHYRLNAVAAHEFGHVYALGHAGTSNNLMRTSFSTCSKDARVGYGDYIGLDYLY